MQKKKALVIDDDQIVLESLSQILTEEDHEVDITLRGFEGLEWVIQKDYDIVLTDIRMPEIGGMRVLRDAKRAASDCEFFTYLLEYTADALDEYNLTGPEKLTLLTADAEWVEEQIGPLTRSQRRWIEVRKSAEIW